MLGSLRAVMMSFAIVVAGGCKPASPLSGKWTGTAEHAGAAAAVTVEMSDAGSGHLRVTADDNGIFDFPGVLRESGAMVDGEIRPGGEIIRLHGQRSDDSIEGTATLHDFVAHVRLRRTGPASRPRFSEIPTAVPSGSRSLGATLLMPAGPAPHPAVVLIHGSHGPSREDLRGPATLFARNGIAALIYDKRDLGADQRREHRYSFQELADDARAAVRLLKQHGDIDPARIGVFGISEGGWVAPIVASDNSDVAFVITVSAPAVSYAAVEDAMTRAQLRAEGRPQSDIGRAIRLLHRVNDYVRFRGDGAALTRDLEDASRESWAHNIALPRTTPSEEEIRNDVRWRELDLDAGAYWRRVHVPVFAAWGDHDPHPVAESESTMRTALALAGNGEVTLRVFPNATHELLVATRPGEPWQWPRLAPHFIDEMLRWTSARAHP
ncbi:MAG: alpha/beta hydrolase family protein [Thermoanaerobaculia bacterium]